MNEQIALNDLKILIARQSGYDKAFVDVFIDELIGLLEESLLKGEEVRIDGWGTFRRITCSSGLKYKIIFIAEESFRNAVNAPFAQFEPVILVPGAPKEIRKELIENSSVNTLTNQNQPEEDYSVSEPENEQFPIEDFCLLEEDPSRDVVGTDAIGPQSAETEVLDDGNNENLENMDEEAEKTKKEVSSEEVARENQQLSPEQELYREELDAAEGKGCPPGGCKVSEKMVSRNYGVWFVLILLAIAIIGALVYFFVRVETGMKETPVIEQTTPGVTGQSTSSSVNFPELPQETTPGQSQTVPAVLSKDSLSVAGQDSLRKENTIPAVYPPIDKVTLEEGERLTLLALKYYGKKVFWVYIFEANKQKYPDPNNIPEGARLFIPDPKTYDINKADSASVGRARKLEGEILGR